MLLFILGCLQADADLAKSEGKPVIPLYVSNVHNSADSSSVKIIIYDEEDQSKRSVTAQVTTLGIVGTISY